MIKAWFYSALVYLVLALLLATGIMWIVADDFGWGFFQSVSVALSIMFGAALYHVYADIHKEIMDRAGREKAKNAPLI